MGDGERPKKKRKVKAVAAPSDDGEVAAEEGSETAAAGGGATSVAAVLSEALKGKSSAAEKGQDSDGSLTQEYSRLFGSGGGLFAFGAQASQPARTPSASSAAAPRSAGAPSPTQVLKLRKRALHSEAEADNPGSEKAAKDRPDGERQGKAKRTGPKTPEEKREQEKRLLFVGNVPLSWDEKRLRRVLREAVGDKYEGSMRPIWFRSEPLKMTASKEKWKDCHKMKAYVEGLSDSKHGYVQLDSPEAVRIVSKAIHGYKADDDHILRGDAVGEHSSFNSFDRKRSIFVGNLPPATSEADIRKALASAGEIDAVRVVREKESKACKGFAFVRFVNRWSLKVALDLWDAEVQGRTIRIQNVTDQSVEGKAKARHEWELTPAARRILMKAQRKERSKVNKAVAKRKEALAVAGKRPGKRNIKKKRKDTNRPKGKSTKGKKAKR